MNSMPASNVKLWRKNWETFGSTEVGTRKYQLSKGDPQKPGKMFTIQHPKQLNIYRDPNKKTIPWPFTREEDLKAHLQTSEMTEASLLLFSRRIIFPPLMVVPTCSTDTINSHVWEVVVLLIFFFFSIFYQQPTFIDCSKHGQLFFTIRFQLWRNEKLRWEWKNLSFELMIIFYSIPSFYTGTNITISLL